MIHIYWLGTQVSKWSPNSMKQKESKVLSASLLRLEAWAQHELQDTNHVTLSRILQRVVVPLASLVTNKPCTGSQEFRNIRLRLTIHLDTTCVHTQPLKPPSRGTPPNYGPDSSHHHLPLGHLPILIETDYQDTLENAKWETKRKNCRKRPKKLKVTRKELKLRNKRRLKPFTNFKEVFTEEKIELTLWKTKGTF